MAAGTDVALQAGDVRPRPERSAARGISEEDFRNAPVSVEAPMTKVKIRRILSRPLE
jgi:hypothetical protein